MSAKIIEIKLEWMTARRTSRLCNTSSAMTNDRTAVHCRISHRARGYRGFRARLHFSSATLSLTSVRKEVVDTRSTKHFLCTLLDAILNSHLASFKTWHSVGFHRSSLLFIIIIIITLRKGALYQIASLHTNMVRKKRLDAIEFDREEKVRVLFFLTLSRWQRRVSSVPMKDRRNRSSFALILREIIEKGLRRSCAVSRLPRVPIRTPDVTK